MPKTKLERRKFLKGTLAAGILTSATDSSASSDAKRGAIQRLQPPGDFSISLAAYSQGIKVPLPGADLIFLSGQIAIDHRGEVVAPGDPERQTEFVFRNIEKILGEGGASLQDVVKAQIFVTNMVDYPRISAVRNKYFSENKPVSTLVEVSRLVKQGCCVEVEVIAVKLKKA